MFTKFGTVLEGGLINRFKSFPYLDKVKVGQVLNKDGENLNYWLKKLISNQTLLPLKNGLYASSLYLLTLSAMEKELYLEYLANILRYPSYVSLEYALAKYGLIPESVYTLTSVTVKSTRSYRTSLGEFSYRSLRPSLFCGYQYLSFREKRVAIATPAKALFDFLYFHASPSAEVLARELTVNLRVNWQALSPSERTKFFQLLKSNPSSKNKLTADIIRKEKLL